MIPNEEEALIKKAMEAAKKTPQGMDFPILGPEQKFPINLYCNDSLEPSTSANNRSVYTRWIRNGTGLVNLYVNGDALKILEDNSDKPKFIWLGITSRVTSYTKVNSIERLHVLLCSRERKLSNLFY